MSENIIHIKRFLQTISLLHIVIGLLFPWIVGSPLFEPYHNHLHLAFGVEQNSAKQQAAFLMAIFGPTIASWGVLFLYAVNSGFSRPTSQSWWFMVAACLVWAPYDSIFSLQYGVYFNAVINSAAFVFIMPPLFMVRKHFFSRP